MAENFTMTLLVDQSPEQVFNAVQNVRGWWQGFYSEEINGESKSLNDEFTFRAGDGAHFTRQKLVDSVPGKRIEWLVTESKLTFIQEQDEWKGTTFGFDISENAGKTKVVFTHHGLTPEVECYDACSTAWSLYLREKLLLLIENASPHKQPQQSR